MPNGSAASEGCHSIRLVRTCPASSTPRHRVTFRASDFLQWHGELRHLIGRVESEHYLFAGLWITCAVMQTGTFDFRERLCMRYDLSFSPLLPEGEWPLAGGSPRWEGYGIVAEAKQIIDEYLASLTQGA